MSDFQEEVNGRTAEYSNNFSQQSMYPYPVYLPPISYSSNMASNLYSCNENEGQFFYPSKSFGTASYQNELTFVGADHHSSPQILPYQTDSNEILTTSKNVENQHLENCLLNYEEIKEIFSTKNDTASMRNDKIDNDDVKAVKKEPDEEKTMPIIEDIGDLQVITEVEAISSNVEFSLEESTTSKETSEKETIENNSKDMTKNTKINSTNGLASKSHSAFVVFGQSHRSTIEQRYPLDGHKMIGLKLWMMWRNLPENIKIIYRLKSIIIELEHQLKTKDLFIPELSKRFQENDENSFLSLKKSKPAFSKFCREFRPKLKKLFPDEDTKAISAKLDDLWMNLPYEAMEKYGQKSTHSRNKKVDGTTSLKSTPSKREKRTLHERSQSDDVPLRKKALVENLIHASNE